eukprot:3717917-Amphidinium_carterae.2
MNTCTDSPCWQGGTMLDFNSWNFLGRAGLDIMFCPTPGLNQDVSLGARLPWGYDEYNFCFPNVSDVLSQPLNSSIVLNCSCAGRQQLHYDNNRRQEAERNGRPPQQRAPQRRRGRQRLLPPLRFGTINVRSLLCDDSPGLAETARSQIFRSEMGSKHLDLIMVQETKLDKKYVFDCEEYYAVAISPIDGVGGLQTLLAKSKVLRILWTREFSSRVLAVAFAWGSERWCAINVYLPTSAAPQHVYEAEWAYVLEAWALAKYNGLAIITAGDFNARLGGHRDDIHIGSAVTGGLQPEMRQRAAVVADSLQSVGLSAWSTLLGSPHTTWTSPHDTEAQLDYAAEHCNRAPGQDASDHKLVWGEIESKGPLQGPTTRLRPKPCKVQDADHDLAIRLALATADHEPWKSEANPIDAMNGCLKLVREVAKNAPKPQAVLKQDWIGNVAWAEIRKGAALRRKLETAAKSRRKAAVSWAWLMMSQANTASYAADIIDDTGIVARQHSQHLHNSAVERYMIYMLLWMLWRVACKRQSKVVQRLVRQDKTAWLARKTEELARIEQEGVSSETHKQVKRCLTKIRQNQVAIKRGPIRDSAGILKTTQDEKELVWQEHWGRLYAGKMLSTKRSFTSCPKNWTSVSLGLVSEEAKFTELEVEAALKHQMTNKASVDGIPAKQLNSIRHHLVPTWTRAFNYFLEVGDLPEIYKGTLIFVTPKKVAPSTPGDYRGLQLMMWTAKVFARALYCKCISRVEIAVGQYGLGRNTGIDYPHVVVTQISEWAKHHRRRLGWWYIDVKTAFDKIIRQLLYAPGDTLTLDTLVALGIDVKIARGILLEVAQDRPILWEQNLPGELQRILASLIQNTWILLPPEQGEAQLSTHMGTPQGNSLSGLLYILYQQRIMAQITQYMHEMDIALTLPAVEDNTFVVSHTGRQIIPMLAYHDDALAIIESHSAESIVDKMRQL